jgi:hypothetical protein
MLEAQVAIQLSVLLCGMKLIFVPFVDSFAHHCHVFIVLVCLALSFVADISLMIGGLATLEKLN